MAREFTTVGVVGLGTMGAGIAEVFARNGFEVVGVEQSDEQLQRGRTHIHQSTNRAVRRGKLDPQDQQAIFHRLTLTRSMSDLADCDLVVEAVVERLDLKRSIFSQLDKIVRPDAVLATNTSSLSVTEIAASTSQPGRVVGLHFFNPAPVQQLVEVVRTVVTEPAVVEEVQGVARRLGKNPVTVGDKAGFIANALLLSYLNRAAAFYESRYASRADIDAAMRVGCGYPMGPLALLDLIGLDTAYQILETMYGESRNRLHAPTPLIKQMVTAGLLGRKTGRGFYTYEAADNPTVVVADAETPSPDPDPHRARSLRRIGVVGSGPLANGIVKAFGNGGLEVSHAADLGSLQQVGEEDLVVEAVSDDPEEKKAVLEHLGKVCGPDAILATTITDITAVPVVEIAVATGRQQDVVGLHFIDPTASSDLVEVVSTVSTSADVTATVQALVMALGKQPVLCGDRAGFVVNALLFPYLNDAVRMLDDHYASADDIDTAMKQGCALPMGPFEVLDMVGTDVSLTIQRQLYRESREPGLAPAPLLEHLVTAGYLGRKTGRGFREYSAP